MAFLLEHLDVYKKGLKFAETVTSLAEGFPRGKWFLADQLNRAALSISANIAEGSGRYHAKDRRNFLIIARGSTHECVPFLEFANHTGLIQAETCDQLIGELEVISRMLSGLIRKL